MVNLKSLTINADFFPAYNQNNIFQFLENMKYLEKLTIHYIDPRKKYQRDIIGKLIKRGSMTKLKEFNIFCRGYAEEF
jgi:hypothetical protein